MFPNPWGFFYSNTISNGSCHSSVPISVRPSEANGMDCVPVTFMQAVLRNFYDGINSRVKGLPGIWGKVGQNFVKKSGVLELTFAPCDLAEKDWRLHYHLDDFEHIKTRTLSREVVKEMARSVKYIHCSMSEYSIQRALDELWNSIAPNDVDQLQLLVALDAPEKALDLTDMYSYFESSFNIDFYSKYSAFLRSFTSVIFENIDQEPFQRLAKDMIATGRMWWIDIWDQVPEHMPASLWLDYFFSNSCKALEASFDDRSVVREAIDRWKSMDPRTLCASSRKVLCGRNVDALAGVDMKKIDVEAEATLFEKIKRLERVVRPIVSLHRIDHPVDPGSSIYIVTLERRSYASSDDCVLVFE
uniref:F-box domain-containing protein n=1 Tax=Steinernema glaseri TaxID=37863 RepID=A0A1I8AC51_9BILA